VQKSGHPYVKLTKNARIEHLKILTKHFVKNVLLENYKKQKISF